MAQKAKGGGVEFVTTKGKTDTTKIYKADTDGKKQRVVKHVKKAHNITEDIDIDNKSEKTYIAVEKNQEIVDKKKFVQNTRCKQWIPF